MWMEAINCYCLDLQLFLLMWGVQLSMVEIEVLL